MDYDEHLRLLEEASKKDRAPLPGTAKDTLLAARAQSDELSERGLSVDAQGSQSAELGQHIEAQQGSQREVAAQAQQAFSEESQKLPHHEQLAKLFGHHDLSHIEAHVGGQAERGLEALNARGLASDERVALAADANIAEVARQVAMSLVHQAQQRGQDTVQERTDQEALLEAIGQGVLEGRDVQELLDRLTGLTDGRGEAGLSSAASAAYDGVGLAVADHEDDDDEDEGEQERALSPQEIAERALQRESAALAEQAQVGPSWFERVHEPLSLMNDLTFDPPPLHARRRKRLGQGWLFDVQKNAAQAPAPARESSTERDKN